MIAEGEEDIKAGRLHSQQEVKDFIKNWKPWRNRFLGLSEQKKIWARFFGSIQHFYGLEKAQEIVESIREHTEVWENPNYNFKKIGERDEAFSHLKRIYRKLIQRHCKITYREGKTKIYIVRVFDTRRDPKKNK
jgi:plasmid stabilization system protein ParE